MSTIDLSSVVRRREGLLANELSDDEAVMLDVDRGMYFGVRVVGKAIWDRLEEQVRVEDLCSDLTEQFDVEPKRCEQDVLAFLEQLREQGLVEVQSEG